MESNEFSRLVEIMHQLRGENGCPWDRAQTHASLRQYLLEEAYEVLESLDEQNFNELKGELGDLLLQIIFHAEIAQEQGNFTIWDVVRSINEKLIRRHPHVFGEMQLTTPDAVVMNWEKIKLREGKKSVIDGVPRALSGLLRTFRIQKKAAQVGFDSNGSASVWSKFEAEKDALHAAIQTQDPAAVQAKFGDLLFELINLARIHKINPEDALRAKTNQFVQLFHRLEQELLASGRLIQDLSAPELFELWQKVSSEHGTDIDTGRGAAPAK